MANGIERGSSPSVSEVSSMPSLSENGSRPGSPSQLGGVGELHEDMGRLGSQMEALREQIEEGNVSRGEVAGVMQFFQYGMEEIESGIDDIQHQEDQAVEQLRSSEAEQEDAAVEVYISRLRAAGYTDEEITQEDIDEFLQSYRQQRDGQDLDEEVLYHSDGE